MMTRRKKRDTPLTKDELFERSLRIIDEEGLEALTMRRLAEDVGVEAASLYHHVPNKDALIDGALVRMRSEIRVPEVMPDDPMDLLVPIFAEYRRVLASHPNLMPYAGKRVETDPDSGLELLTQIGFSDDDAVELWQSLIAYTVGFSMFSSAYAAADTWDLRGALAKRMAEWRDDTCERTLAMIVDAYAVRRRPPGPA